MDHETLKDLVFLSYDREISPADQSLVKKHLTTCAECRDTLAEWQETASLLFPSAKIVASENFVQKVMGRIETGNPLSYNWQTLAAAIKTALFPRWIMAGAAGMAVAAILTLYPFNTSRPSSEAAIEYASDLMEGPYVHIEEHEADNNTAIEEYFL